MSFSWNLYVQLANELIYCPKQALLEQAYFRSSVSRSYYGMFCVARSLLENRGASIPRESTHKFVSEEYQNSLDKLEKKIGKDLRNLWRERKAADYDTGEVFDKNRASDAHKLAVRTLSRLQNKGAIY